MNNYEKLVALLTRQLKCRECGSVPFRTMRDIATLLGYQHARSVDNLKHRKRIHRPTILRICEVTGLPEPVVDRYFNEGNNPSSTPSR